MILKSLSHFKVRDYIIEYDHLSFCDIIVFSCRGVMTALCSEAESSRTESESRIQVNSIGAVCEQLTTASPSMACRTGACTSPSSIPPF